jgi:hypothetical protein
VVPRVTPLVKRAVRQRWKLASLELTPKTLRGVCIDYSMPVYRNDFSRSQTELRNL